MQMVLAPVTSKEDSLLSSVLLVKSSNAHNQSSYDYWKMQELHLLMSILVSVTRSDAALVRLCNAAWLHSDNLSHNTDISLCFLQTQR